MTCRLLQIQVDLCDGSRHVDVSVNTVILPCSYQSHTPVLVLRWNQTNIQAEHENDYVLLDRQGSLVTDHQLRRFQGRVELQDPKLENGNFSLILKNVTDSDDGTYECEIILKTTPEFISLTIVSLIVGERESHRSAAAANISQPSVRFSTVHSGYCLKGSV
uniref:Ig-like domain-containing protein n=1 Tax=Salarias fasciatus TaxID=181472 RepID=A0A672HMN9_SALFA